MSRGRSWRRVRRYSRDRRGGEFDFSFLRGSRWFEAGTMLETNDESSLRFWFFFDVDYRVQELTKDKKVRAEMPEFGVGGEVVSLTSFPPPFPSFTPQGLERSVEELRQKIQELNSGGSTSSVSPKI